MTDKYTKRRVTQIHMDAIAARHAPAKFRVVLKMAIGPTRYGNWLTKENATNSMNAINFLLEGEWVGIQQQGLETEIVHCGPWRNID